MFIVVAAKFLDAQLKSGNKEWSDEDLERLFDRVMVLFRYIHGRDTPHLYLSKYIFPYLSQVYT